MSVVIERMDGSPELSVGTPDSGVSVKYIVTGAELYDDAYNALVAAVPSLFDLFGNGLFLLPRKSIGWRRVGKDVWEADVVYSTSATTDDGVPGLISESVRVTRSTEHITASKETRFASTGAPDHKNMIGVTENGVEGCDIRIAGCAYSLEYLLPDSFVTASWRRDVFNLARNTPINDAAFKGLERGEVSFEGFSLERRRGEGNWRATFEFIVSPNVTGIDVGDISEPLAVKEGHDYFWVMSRRSEDATAKSIVSRPIAFYVERVYDYGDFSIIGIGT